MHIDQIPPGYKLTEVGIIPSDWDVKRLGDIFDFKNGLNKEKSFFGQGTPIVNYMDVYKHNALIAQKIVGKVTVSKNELKNYEVCKGDVFFTRTSETVDEIGVASVVIEDLENTVFSGFVLRARPKNDLLDILYKKYCFASYQVRKMITSQSSYTTRALTNGKLLSKVQIPLPPIEEQKRIAQVLSDIDELIRSLDELIIKKRNIKQGTMQLLLTGKQRLPGYSGEWEVKKLGDLCEFTQGIQIPQSEQINFPKEGYIRYLYIRDFFSNDFQSFVENKYHDKIMNSSDIMMVNTGNTAGTAYSGAKGVLSNNAFKITFDYQMLNRDYLFIFLRDSSTQRKIKSSFNLAGQPHVGHKNIAQLEISLPPLEEQKAIARILSDMDEEIEVLEAKRNKYQDIKKGMMQELLTGKTRLV
jgi:type I restriction enzyme S subunit